MHFGPNNGYHIRHQDGLFIHKEDLGLLGGVTYDIRTFSGYLWEIYDLMLSLYRNRRLEAKQEETSHVASWRNHAVKLCPDTLGQYRAS